MILKQGANININADLIIYRNWKAMHMLLHLYLHKTRRSVQFSSQPRLYLRQQTKSRQLSMSYHQHNCHPLPVRLPSTYLRPSLHQPLCYSHKRQLFTVHRNLCPRQTPPFRPPRQCRCRCYQHKLQFSQSHSLAGLEP